MLSAELLVLLSAHFARLSGIPYAGLLNKAECITLGIQRLTKNMMVKGIMGHQSETFRLQRKGCQKELKGVVTPISEAFNNLTGSFIYRI